MPERNKNNTAFRVLMVEAGLNTSTLAKKAGVSRPVIQKIIDGNGNVRLDMVERLAYALGQSVETVTATMYQ